MDEEGTKEARALMGEISRRLYSVTIEALKKKFGENWWFEGVPNSVRVSCSERHEIDKGKKEKSQYISLLSG